MKMLSDQLLIETAQRFDTPAFLFDKEIIKEKYNNLRKWLVPDCEIFYSMKANPAIAICNVLKTLGASCEISSKNELLTAQKAGFLSNQIIFVGPGKKDNDIELCIQQKIKAIVCESIEEIQRVNRLSEKNNFVMPIYVRINPNFFVKNAPIKMSGVASQFGIEEKQLIAEWASIKKLKNISLNGLQIYNASRVLDFQAIAENIFQILKLADSLSREFHIQWKTIDVGGGFGIPYFENEEALLDRELIHVVNKLFIDYKNAHSETNFILELGRYLVAESGYLISTVNSIKKSHEKNYIIVDAGMHCLLAATGLGSFVHRNFPMHYIPLCNIKNEYDYDQKIFQVAGPLCTPGDMLLKNILLPSNMSRGDLIIILNAGAYGLSASPGKFLSHGSPIEVMHDQGRLYCIRRRETIDDILSTQHMENNDVKH